MKYYTPKEIAKAMHVEIRTVYRKLRSGELKAVKWSRKVWRVREEDLEAYLKNLEYKK